MRTHALALLRAPDAACTTFPKLMARVLADVRADTEAAARREEEEEGGGAGRRDRRGEREGGGLEVPEAVVREGVRLTRECLEQVVEVEP